MRTAILTVALLAASACRSNPGDTGPDAVDADQDGVAADRDCDDADPDRYPGAAEACDGVDNDCDGDIDENAGDDAVTYYLDADGDGHGNANAPQTACAAPAGYVESSDDCNDARDDVHPGAEETDCNDPTDYNCDGSVGFEDGDADGFAACADCDDDNPRTNPVALELCDGEDNDCDEDVDENAVDSPTWYADADGDGYGDPDAPTRACEVPEDHVGNDDDCFDGDDATYPGAPESCDSADRNCDGHPTQGAQDADTWYADLDGDGHAGDVVSVEACDRPDGYFLSADDCNDLSPAARPGGTEVCDGLDNDCNGEVDEAGDLNDYWLDDDDDGYGDPDSHVEACAPPDNHVANDQDCDDDKAFVHPGAEERCDGLDRNCDGELTLGAVDAVPYHLDLDRDGYGDPEVIQFACVQPARYVVDGTDCDDVDPDVFPGNPEVCDNADNDCNQAIDDDPADIRTWYEDDDGDGYGDPSDPVLACFQTAGLVADSSDCDDNALTGGDIHPGADERCDPVDRDCDGSATADAVDADTFYLDHDRDGVGDADFPRQACTMPTRHSATSGDCDDLDAAVFPGNTEVCDGKDNDCNDAVDDDASDAPTWYFDQDRDGFGRDAPTQVACDRPDQYAANADDCADTDATIHPSAAERCDAVDRDCDGDPVAGAVDADTWYQDYDGDGFADGRFTLDACAKPDGYTDTIGDCYDTDPTSYPGADERCDAVDHDCDGDPHAGAVDGTLYFPDADGDGYGDPTAGELHCERPADMYEDDSDCADDDPTAFPGSTAIETPFDGVDQDCDGNDWCTDLNCDGLPDVLLGCHHDGDYNCSMQLWTTSPSGWRASQSFPQSGTLGQTHHDLDGDGYQDIIQAFYSVSPTNRRINSQILWGSADGYDVADRLELPTLGAEWACVGDWNGDDRPDVAFANHYDNSSYNIPAYVYWNSATGFSPGNRSELPGHGSWYCEAEDVDGDGIDDLVLPGWYDGDDNSTSYVYFGSVAGLDPSDRVTFPAQRTRDIDFADLDGDGFKDAVVTNYYDGDYSVDSYIYWGSAAGWSPNDRTPLPGHGVQQAHIEDFNKDGHLDIALMSHYSGSSHATTNYVYWGGPGGYSTNNRTGLFGHGGHGMVVGDIDQDGWTDLFFPGYHNGSTYAVNSHIYWGSRLGFSNSNRTELPGVGVLHADVADVNHDGWNDILMPSYHAGNWSIQTYTWLYYGGPQGFSTQRREQFTQWGAWHGMFVGAGAMAER